MHAKAWDHVKELPSIPSATTLVLENGPVEADKSIWVPTVAPPNNLVMFNPPLLTIGTALERIF